jgi:hypothetical protein
MTGSGSAPDPLGQLADEFLERHRRGEQPALTGYTARHPELAEQIRELFPALVLMEDVRFTSRAARCSTPGSPRCSGRVAMLLGKRGAKAV